MDVLLLKIINFASWFLTHLFIVMSVPSTEIKEILLSALSLRFGLQGRKKWSKTDGEFCFMETLLVLHSFSMLKFSIFEINYTSARRRNAY